MVLATRSGASVGGEELSTLLVDAITDHAVYMLDPNGVVTSWNVGAQRIKGYRADEIIGEHFSRFYTEDDRARGEPARVLEAALRDGKFEMEGWRVRKDGSRFWAGVVVQPVRDRAGTLIGFAKLTRDMTERRAAQEALHASERRFRLLVQGITDYAIYMLGPDGRITDWNAGAERIKGYRAEEIIGQHFSTFYTDEDRAAGVPDQALATAAREGRYESEGWRVRKDGGRVWASAVIDAIRDDDGRLLGFAKITRDITERQNAQQALEQARAALFQAQKMEALGQLTGGIAHDFNNLLTVVMGNLDLLRRAPEERRSRLIENALQAVEQGRKLTQQLLAFGRRQNLRPEVIDVNRLIVGMGDMLAQSLRGDIAIELDLADGLWSVEVDPNELQVALINLATNARDAMPDGGTFRVRTGNTVRCDGAAVEGVTISVTDTGSGMPRDVIARVFEPFFTTKPVGKGTGLGLAQVYGFAQQSGGSIDIRSEVDHGTTVTIHLPRAEAKPESRHGPVPPETPARTLRILIVEDNPQVAEVASALLVERGHSVLRVGDAEEALHVLNSGQTFDLVLSDMVMPGRMNGLDLARRVRDRWPSLAVLLATGYSEAASRATREGFALVSKPYQPDMLVEAIHRTASPGSGRLRDGNIVSLRRGNARQRRESSATGA